MSRLLTTFFHITRKVLPGLDMIHILWLQDARGDGKLDVGYQLLGEGAKNEGRYRH